MSNELNARRLELLQEDPATRYANHGVIALDDVLVDHDGKLIEDVGWFWDHAEDRTRSPTTTCSPTTSAPSGQHYPLEFRRFKKREQCEATRRRQFEDHGVLFRQLVDWVCEHEIPGDFAFDSYFSSAENLNHIHGKLDAAGDPRAYVGDLKTNRKLEVRGQSRSERTSSPRRFPAKSAGNCVAATSGSGTTPPSSALPQVKHPVRIVLLWRNRRDQTPAKVLVTNRTRWEITRILKTYRQRWTGTETFHRDGKQELGMGDCQLRSGQGQTRHMHLVMAAYSLLMRQLRNSRATKWALRQADDHRPSLPRRCRRDPPHHPPMGHDANHRKISKTTTRYRPIGIELAFCKSPVSGIRIIGD